MDRWVGARRRAIQVSLDIEPHPSRVLSPSDFRTVQGFAERYLRDHQIPQELASRVKRFQKRRSKKRSSSKLGDSYLVDVEQILTKQSVTKNLCCELRKTHLGKVLC